MNKKESEKMLAISVEKNQIINDLTEQLRVTGEKLKTQRGFWYNNFLQEYLELEARQVRLVNRILALGFPAPKRVEW